MSKFTKKCDKCGTELRKFAWKCPKCNQRNSEKKKPKEPIVTDWKYFDEKYNK